MESQAPNPPTRPVHALTVDVEDYFHVQAFRRQVNPERWRHYPIRVDDNTYRLLDLFDQFQVKGTFFILGWVARQSPRLVAEIARRGHEIACDSYWHRLVYDLEPAEFQRDTQEATKVLEDAAGTKLYGYRAPSYSITRESIWALELIAEEGYTYDSSIVPLWHDTYGFRGFPRFPVNVHWTASTGPTASTPAASDGFVEFPPCTARLFGVNLPGPGGGYLRIFPRWYAAWALRHLEQVHGRSGTLYIHPWELDPDQPRILAPLKSRLRHYTRLDQTEARLVTLLERFRFAPMGEVLRTNPPKDAWTVPTVTVPLTVPVPG